MVPVRVIEYHSAKYGMPIGQSQAVYFSLEAFLNNAFNAIESVPTVEVDEAWHTFILHTRQYHDYCMVTFGRFIHHNPHPINLINNCDTGGQQRAKCDKEDDDKKCEAGFSNQVFAKCDDGSETGRCDAQLTEILKLAN
ncbi:hypothetical protein [Mucilaginibacter flavus]|uniref:hypothetical protein n=1 Tax=Mucilaginibacter flavus TaxID=931504 RepID=UPI0025B4FE3F|nr:hypothetical protein [Mucilaginibacter flavus]MDN3581264.1 hypothetical protein [Mucilaginibacter flavus]